MTLRAVTTVVMMGLLSRTADAQNALKAAGNPNERMSCNELIQLQADKQRWDRVSIASPTTDTGWSLPVKRMGLLNERNAVRATWDDVRAVELGAEALDAVAAVVMPHNSVATGSEPPWMPYFYRWIAAKPVKFYGNDLTRCSDEIARVARPGAQEVLTKRLPRPDELNNRYTIIGYDDRKNILFTADFVVRPGPSRPTMCFGVQV